MSKPESLKPGAAPGSRPAPIPPDRSGPLAARLWRSHVRKLWPRLIVVLIVTAITAGTTGLYPVIINHAYDSFTARDTVAIAFLPVAVVLVTVVKSVALYLQVALTNRVATRIETELQIELYDHLVAADVARLSRETPAALTQRFTTDLGFIREALTRATSSMVRDAMTLIAVFGAMLWLDWQLSLLSLIILPFAVIPVQRIGKRVRRVTTTQQEQMGLMAGLVSESFGAARVVKSYRLEDYLRTRANTVFEVIRGLKIKTADQRSRVEPVMEALGGFAVALVLAVVGWRIGSGASSVGEFTGFISALLLAAQPLRGIGSLNTILQQGFSALERVFAVIDEPASVVDRPGAQPLQVSHGDIRFEAVRFRYPDGTLALDGLDLVVPGGKTTAIVGRSGAGKSTIFGLLPRLYDIEAGRILIDGTDIGTVTLASLRQSVGMVTQEAVLFDDTVKANIALGRPGAPEADIEAAAAAAAADRFIGRLPQGYDTPVGERGTRLSGGERQRITLARAFLKNAPILLLDEATSALDSESEHLVREAIDRLSQGRTTLVIAHRLSTIRAADQIVVMDQGRVAECGTHDELIALGGLYARLHRLQFQDGGHADAAPATAAGGA
ncbi:ABC transporter ATP-binding protein [Pseudoxanthobacter sp.]|uniref:ABC transporter ATP-binding protein n=1 Tax=Pseudoxanthobacter sp. TaxID=1925742 RepID=UPI002FE40D14